MKARSEQERLFQKFIRNECSEEEIKRLRELMSSDDHKTSFYDLIGNELREDVSEEFKADPSIEGILKDSREKIAARIEDAQRQPMPPVATYRRLWVRIASAAALVLCVGGAIHLHFRQKQEKVTLVNKPSVDLPPGGDKAVLTLADGSKISLTDAANGTITSQSGISVKKTADGQIVYSVGRGRSPAVKSGDQASSTAFNTISTPRGGQFAVVLSDGTKVWLNAASSIRFPASFPAEERRVVVSGEAYFEVAKVLMPAGRAGAALHPGRVPFIVSTAGQVVEVLGTHFNIKGYADEDLVKTTLIEGSVKVRGNASDVVVLRPGEQSQVSRGLAGIKTATVNLEAEMAWKNDQFFFEDEPIESIMKQISRWYDVEIVYKDDLKGKTVWGSVPRFSKISKVLRVLELTGNIHFKIEGRSVIVMK